MSNPKCIYVVTCISGNPWIKDPEPHEKFRTCEWGYFFTLNAAKYTIENNCTDISELGYYQYAILGKKEPGIGSITIPIQWYEFIWNHNVKPREHDGIIIPEFVEAKKIEKPAQYEHLYM